MESLVNALLSNALVATGLASAPLVLSRFGRSPALVHSLWLVVLLKLVTPPLVQVPLVITLPTSQVRIATWDGGLLRPRINPAGVAGTAETRPQAWCKTTASPRHPDATAQSIRPHDPGRR